MTTKYVIAGSVCCGKTTIINMLKEQGYNTLHEIPREIIKEQQQKQNGILPWDKKNALNFQNLVLKKQLEYESKLNRDQTYFLDRGVFDMIAFFFNQGFVPSKELLKKVMKTKYNKIFFIETLPENLFVHDEQRKETYKQNLKLQKLILNLYKSTGMPIIYLPNSLSAKQRVNTILANIN